MSLALPDFAPEDPGWYQRDPHAAFARLRAEDPVHWHEDGGFWCITRHADLLHVSQRPKLFSSERGTQLFEVRSPVASPRPAASPIVGGMSGAMDGPSAGGDNASSIIRMDPPAHNRYRKLVIGGFTPGRVAAMEPWIRQIAVESLDAIEPDGPVDLVDRIAVPLPMIVIADLLGVPRDDMPRFRHWSDAMVELGGGQFSPEAVAVVPQILAYVSEVTRERRRAPKDDLISRLVDAEIDGERLTDLDIGKFCLTLLVAGNETTRNLIAGGAQALMERPAQRARLCADPAGISLAVEEMLRWVTPVRSFVRCATRDSELAGRTIREGEYVVLFYASANRDETVFGPDADRFDATRESARRHVAFGFGEHLCIGASLARLEARVLFEELLARWPAFEPAGEPEPLLSSLMQGYVHLPVRLAA